MIFCVSGITGRDEHSELQNGKKPGSEIFPGFFCGISGQPVRRFAAECQPESTTYLGAVIAHHPVRRFEEIANVTPTTTFECWIVTGVAFLCNSSIDFPCFETTGRPKRVDRPAYFFRQNRPTTRFLDGAPAWYSRRPNRLNSAAKREEAAHHSRVPSLPNSTLGAWLKLWTEQFSV